MSASTHIPGRQLSASDIRVRRMAGSIVVALLVFALVGPVSAQADDFEISIPVDTVVRGVEAGSIVPLTDPPVLSPEDLVGRECTVVASSENQTSVHPNNHLVVSTGESEVRIEDVESAPALTTNATGNVILGPEVTISLVMGPDRAFSAGIDVTIDCAPGATTTTRATTSSSIEPSTTAPGSSTTTVDGSTTTLDSSTSSVVSSTTTLETSTTTGTEPTTTTMGEGSGTDGTITTEASTTSIDDETDETEVLPFTGFGDDGRMGLFALALVGLGLMLVVGGRVVGVGGLPWATRCGQCDRPAEFATPHGKLCMTHTRRALHADTELWVPRRIDAGGSSGWLPG